MMDVVEFKKHLLGAFWGGFVSGVMAAAWLAFVIWILLK